MLFINKLFNSIACLLSFTNLQLVIPGRTWILLYLGRTVYKRLWACLALYIPLADLGGGVRDTRPPWASKFFRFHAVFRENLACSRPPWRVHVPPSGKSWIRHCIRPFISPFYSFCWTNIFFLYLRYYIFHRCICISPHFFEFPNHVSSTRTT